MAVGSGDGTGVGASAGPVVGLGVGVSSGSDVSLGSGVSAGTGIEVDCASVGDRVADAWVGTVAGP